MQEDIQDAVEIPDEVNQPLQLDEFELRKLQTILQKRNQVANEIVDIKYMRRQADLKEKQIDTYLDSVDSEQNDYIRTLEEKYGKVSINPETGILTPLQEA